jgi:DNA-binding NarL/FixJ family response regulator
MTIDEIVLGALKRAVSAVKDETPRPVPVEILKPLVDIARPGSHVHLDIEASRTIGAPIVTIASNPDDAKLLAPLTRRQKEVAKLIIEGLSNRAIASQLGISLATVKDHVHAILERLELPSRTALVAAARH